MTALSCTLVRRPMVMGATSPRTTAPNQKLASSPMVMSPVRVQFQAANQLPGVWVIRFIPRGRLRPVGGEIQSHFRIDGDKTGLDIERTGQRRGVEADAGAASGLGVVNEFLQDRRGQT